MNLWQRLLDLTRAGPFTGPGMSFLTALGTLAVLIFMRRRLPRENRDHGSVLQTFLVIGASLALLRLGLLAVGGGHLAFGRVMAVLSTFFVAMGAVGTLVMGMFEILPARANVHFPLLLRDLILVLAFVVVLFGVLGQSGVDVTSMVTTSAVLTAILGLALQSTLTNLLAGILLHMDRSLGVGDWVQFGERKGCIMEIRWRSTVLRTTDGEVMAKILVRRTAKTRPCRSGATLACQMAWLQAFVKGPQNMMAIPQTAIKGSDARSPTALRNNPLSKADPRRV